jgi:hypothetical protein
MAATGLLPLVDVAATAHVEALGHEIADTEVSPLGTDGDQVSGDPMDPERITGPVVEVPMATQTVVEGQTS